eukprot:TRINITY_DN12559_c0_g1_i1.p1 TRINITY_DN12559_c0_g1~~TRINITY_DN12559_c0_g1_i1.p1  ORF type:complete len:624 (-),score=100.92 TRINITY_DN12559_c0_g1_i1:40-1911(-)
MNRRSFLLSWLTIVNFLLIAVLSQPEQTFLQLSSPVTVHYTDQFSLQTTLTFDSASNFSPTGQVIFYAVGPNGGSQIGAVQISSDNQAILLVSDFVSGSYQVWGEYLGDLNYQHSLSLKNTITVLPAVVSLTVSPSSTTVPFGKLGIFTFTLAFPPSDSSTPSGYFNIIDSQSSYSSTQKVTGFTTYFSACLGVGNHLLHITFTGDANHQEASEIVTLNVASVSSIVSVSSSSNPSVSGEKVNLQVSVDAQPIRGACSNVPEPTGFIVVSEGNQHVASAPLEYPANNLTLSSLSQSHHYLLVSYSGDSNYLPSSVSFEQNVIKAGTQVQMAYSGDFIQGNLQSISVTVTVPGSKVVPSGQIYYSLDESPAKLLGKIKGAATFQLCVAEFPGQHAFQISFMGTGYQPSTTAAYVNVVKGPSNVSASWSDESALIGEVARLNGRVKRMTDCAQMEFYGDVGLMLNGELLQRHVVDPDGTFSFYVRFESTKHFSYNFTVLFYGDYNLRDSSHMVSALVRKGDTSVSLSFLPELKSLVTSKIVNVTATIVQEKRASSLAVPTGKVKFSLETQEKIYVKLQGNSATLPIRVSPSKDKKSVLSVQYSGDDDYESSSINYQIPGKITFSD